MADGLTFQIKPEGEFTSLDLFVRALEDVRKLVIEVDYAVNRKRSGKRWAVTRLNSSSPTFTIAPAGYPALRDSGFEQSISAIVVGIEEITQDADRPPQYFTEDGLKCLMKMRRHFSGQGKADSICVSANGDGPTAITGDIGRQVKKILASGYSGLGSLEGHLEAVNFHRRPNFTVWERVSRAPVRCSLPNTPDWKELTKSLLEKRVLVQGRIRYFSNGVPQSVGDVQDILDNTPDPTLPRSEFGCIPDDEAAEDPAKFVRAIRGYDEE